MDVPPSPSYDHFIIKDVSLSAPWTLLCFPMYLYVLSFSIFINATPSPLHYLKAGRDLGHLLMVPCLLNDVM